MSRRRSRTTRSHARAAPPALSAPPPRADRRPGLVAAGLIAVIVAAYSNSFAAGFVLDNSLITDDARLHDWTWVNLRRIVTENYWGSAHLSDLYRPVTSLTYAFDYAVMGYGKSPTGYHVVNLLLHVLNTLLVFRITRGMVGDLPSSTFAAALFALHPLATEAVTNIVGRADLLAALFVLSAVDLHLQSKRDGRVGSPVHVIGLGALTFLGMLSKENAVILPALIVLADLATPSEGARPRILPYLSIGAACVAVFLARYVVLAQVVDEPAVVLDNPIRAAGFWTARMTAVKVLGYYLALFAWPMRQSCDYSYNEVPLFSWTLWSGSDWHAWLSLLAYLVFTAALLWGLKRHRAFSFFAGFFLVALSPVSNVFNLTGTIMAERLLYLPSVGLVGVVAGLLTAGKVTCRPRAGLGALAVLALGALGMRTFVRNEDWRTEQTLWRSAAKVAPDSYRVCRSVAHALFESSGDEPPMDDVVRWAERSRAIVDSSPVPPVDRPRAVYRSLAVYYAAYGDLLARRGEQEKARARYESAAEALERVLAQEHGRGRATAPGVIAEHSLLLGRTYLALARFEDALKVLDEADSIDPEDAVAYYLRGKAQLGRDSYDAAARSLATVVLLGGPVPDEVWSLIETTYGRLTPGQPAILRQAGRTMLTRENPAVRSHLVGASHDLVERLMRRGRPAEARRIRDIASEQLAIEPSFFDDVLSPQETLR